MSDNLFISSNQTSASRFASEEAFRRENEAGRKTRLSKARSVAEHIDAIQVEDPPPPRPGRYDPPPLTIEEECFRHSGWATKRQHVREALARCGTPTSTLERFNCCGSGGVVEWSETEQRHRVTANFCKNRHCEPCMKARATKVRLNLGEKLKNDERKQHRFITLTLKHSDSPLPDQLKKLYGSFSKLRTKPLWKKSQLGGCFLCEVKLGQDGKWHPHMHVISQGGWIDQSKLAEAWHAVTGDSHIVDVRLLQRTKDAINYVSKYITKGCSGNVWVDPSKADEWVIASRSLRICSTFGTWRGISLTAVNKTATDWSPVCSLRDLYARASSGEEHAKNLVKLLRGPDASEVDKNRPPPEPEWTPPWVD